MACALVLIADDDVVYRQILATALEGAGFETLQAQNGQEAVDLAHERDPAVIILDGVMPEMDGFAVCRVLKADDRTADTPIVLMSALAQTHDKVQGLACGASDYLTKPIAEEELVARVRNLAALRQRIDAIKAEIDALREHVTSGAGDGMRSKQK